MEASNKKAGNLVFDGLSKRKAMSVFGRGYFKTSGRLTWQKGEGWRAKKRDVRLEDHTGGRGVEAEGKERKWRSPLWSELQVWRRLGAHTPGQNCLPLPGPGGVQGIATPPGDVGRSAATSDGLLGPPVPAGGVPCPRPLRARRAAAPVESPWSPAPGAAGTSGAAAGDP